LFRVESDKLLIFKVQGKANHVGTDLVNDLMEDPDTGLRG
jgi:hypothetical protein